jgi:ABC-type branched-subunit amino acid transport system substrate-binding protein
MAVALIGCRHAAQAQPAPQGEPPPGALGLPGPVEPAPPPTAAPPAAPQGVDALGAAAVRELAAGPSRREQAATLLRAYRDATDQPHERAWADSELAALGLGEGPAAHTAPMRRIGLLAPLSGRLRPVGQRMLEGALLAADHVVVEIADTRSEAARAGDEAERLRGLFATVGPAARDELVAVRARQPGATLLPLVAGEGLSGAGERVGALLEAARRMDPKVKRCAILAPTGTAGDDAAAALRAGGAEVFVESRYPPGAKHFREAVDGVAGANPDAVVVVDTADQLALIAPALAAGGLWPLPDGPPPRTRGRGVWLLATAEGATQKLLDAAGRYLQGALLAPGFFPDPADDVAGPFVTRFTEEYGHAPGAWEAFAWEAVRAAAAARTAAELGGWRSRWPAVYRVSRAEVHALR